MAPGPGQNQGRGQRPTHPAEDWGAMRQNRGGYQPQFQYQQHYGTQGESPFPSAHRNPENQATSASSHALASSDSMDDRRNPNLFQNVGSPEEGQVMEEGQISESPCRPKSTENAPPIVKAFITPARSTEAPQSGSVSATIHSPLSPANNEAGEIRSAEPEQDPHCSDDRAKKPRLKFGGGLVNSSVPVKP